MADSVERKMGPEEKGERIGGFALAPIFGSTEGPIAVTLTDAG